MKNIITTVLLVITMLFWAINFHVAKFTLEYYSPMGAAAFRFLFATFFLSIFLCFKKGKMLFQIRFSFKEVWYMFLVSFFGIFLTIYFFNKGLLLTNAINGSLIETTNPIVIAIFSLLFLNQKITIKQWLAILISIVGVLIVLVEGNIGKLLLLQFNYGDVYIILMVLTFSVSQIIIKKYLADIDAVLMTTLTSVMALILFMAFSFKELRIVDIPQSTNFWSSIIFMGILGTGFAYAVFYNSVVKKGATLSTLYLNLIPFFAIVLSFFFGSPIYFSQLIGGSIIIIGILLFLRKSNK